MLIDIKTNEKLAPYITFDNTLFDTEHSFFNQLPFIETIAPNAKICPLLIGDIMSNSNSNSNSNINNLYEIMNILKELLLKKGTVLICSSDFSHINGHFNYKISNYIYQNIRNTDNEILQFIYNTIDGSNTSTTKIDEILFLQTVPACGIMALYIFSKLLNLLSTDNILENNSNGRNGSSGSSGSSGSNSNSNSSSSLKKSNIEYKKYMYSRVSCYYTSLTRQYINLFNFNKQQLSPIIDIPNSQISSVSYIGVVFTTQSNIQSKKIIKIQAICSNYEKIALLCLAREQLYYNLLTTLAPPEQIFNLYNTHKKSPTIYINDTQQTQHEHQEQQTQQTQQTQYEQEQKMYSFYKSVVIVPNNLIKTINSPIFNLNLGVFATIYNNNNLAGCVGTLNIENDGNSIEHNVKKYVLLSANDSRFKKSISSISLKNFNMLTFSISILSNIIPITLNKYYSDKFQLNIHGILIKQGNVSGYFLPAVAIKFKYDKQKLLEELCINKVGSTSKECFRADNSKLFYNECIEFLM